MFRWFVRLVFFGAIGWAVYATYDWYMAGHHTRPNMPEGAFSLSYKNGLRAILLDVPNEKETRRYFGFPLVVPHYVRDAWSFCRPPTKDEALDVTLFMEERDMPGERFEGVCKVDVDGDVVIRGLITSVPRL